MSNIHKFEPKQKTGLNIKKMVAVEHMSEISFNTTLVSYDKNGIETSDHNAGFACMAISDNITRYMVKFGNSGQDKGHLLNPYSVYYKAGDETRLDKRRGVRYFEYKNVSENVFVLYLRFLRTQTQSYRLAAEKEILNG